MYPDFENTANPELIDQFVQTYKHAEQEAQLQEMYENGDIKEEDIKNPMYSSNKDSEKNDLPF